MQLLILNTRPVEGGGHERLNQLIESIGDKTWSLPLLQTQAIDFTPPDLSQYQFVIFVSQAAVDSFMHQYHQKLPTSCQCIAIGKATANAIKKYGVKVAFFSTEANSESLVSAPIFNAIHHQHILWIKGDKGRRVIEEALLAKGACVTELQVYQSRPIHYPSSIINEIAQLSFNIVVLTSEQSLIHYYHLFQNHPQMFGLPGVLVLSERLAMLAKKYFKGHILISRHDLILETIQNYKANL